MDVFDETRHLVLGIAKDETGNDALKVRYKNVRSYRVRELEMPKSATTFCAAFKKCPTKMDLVSESDTPIILSFCLN